MARPIHPVVVGTAGHIDHGKSSLVQAITGIDPDRLKEEKERGLTIDLGFARYKLSDGRLLGAQALGEDGVDKRISALAGLLQMGATVYDLEESELCYAPQYGSAKDPVNFSGMVAADVIRGDMPISHWDSIGDAFILDVREPFELAVENVPDAVNIPLGELRSRLDELPRDREIHVICRSGQRAYYATRLLLQGDTLRCQRKASELVFARCRRHMR